MENYCCFLHPKEDYSEKNIEDTCPNCGLPFGFPVNKEYTPATIGDYQVVKPISRGYYGATYIVEISTSIRTKKQVLKVVPVDVYDFFDKDFEEESRLHAAAAEGTQHIIDIDDIFEAEINFGGKTIKCHVAILEFIDGDTLQTILDSRISDASLIGQIAIDLLKVLSELEKKQLFHNDLHPGNIMIERLSKDRKRVGELNESIKAVAIDFGSLDKKTQSGDGKHASDLHWIAQTLDKLSKKIIEDPLDSEARDFRLANLLEERARFLFPPVTSQRTYEFEEVINQIHNVFLQVDFPWKETLRLRNFKDYYNAQTLKPWFVPSLLVDEDDRWISEISNPGPQVITGMRGCGKTMLLQALQFHARAMPQRDRENEEAVINRLEDDKYIGLFVSCTRLLDKHGRQDQPLHKPFARLFVAYALETINAIRHLRELNKNLVHSNAFKFIANVVSEQINGASDLDEKISEYEVEKKLKYILDSLSQGEKKYSINANPVIAFPQLAQTIRKTSKIWQNHYVFFLLDDVSTRVLNDENIKSLVSSLLFQNEICSFKFTTEAQTLEMVINSPGNVERARIGRDYNVFDLGQEVNDKVHSNKAEGVSFVEKILFKRAKFYSGHPNLKPSEILGDSSLKSIAEEISKPGKASEKKGLYHGMTAIASVCVGDIGDVITLYELMLKKSNNSYPISPKDQNQCFLELCNSRLFDINRTESRLYDFAESFAEASHSLLLQSYNKRKKLKGNGRARLRQYYSIFINITSGDEEQREKQYQQVRELIDAGIFNFAGGPEASRTNRQGVNPQQQFKLTYRKLYGISKHIGLANSDRFELSGEHLKEWLNNPKKGKEILTRNLAVDLEEDEDLKEKSRSQSSKKSSKLSHQKSIFEQIERNDLVNEEEVGGKLEELAIEKTPKSQLISKDEFGEQNIAVMILGLGFEERTLESLRRILSCKPQKAILIKFEEQGKSKEIRDLLESANITIQEFSFKEALKSEELFKNKSLIDITGLPKAIIFRAIQQTLIRQKKDYFALTEAKKYYPLDKDISKLLERYENEDHTKFLKSLTNTLKGEKGPYRLIPLLPITTSNYSNRRVLIAFSSPKHERLYSLLDEREYDKIHIIVPSSNSPRNKLAKIAAEVALRKYNHAETEEIPLDNLQELMEYISKQYQNYFVNQNFSFEIALTGSKIQAVASAAICSVYKVSQCWYVQPKKWDPKRFTKGTGETNIYKIELP